MIMAENIYTKKHASEQDILEQGRSRYYGKNNFQTFQNYCLLWENALFMAFIFDGYFIKMF